LRRSLAPVAVMLLSGHLIGCKKSAVPDMPVVTGNGTYSQVLKNFQMQDILNGVKNMVLESVEGRIKEQEHIADVDQPRVTFFKQGVASSVLTAPQGQVGMESHEVKAWGGVTVVTTDSSTLTTERLRYDPKTQHLLSDDPVRLEKPDSITVGVGLDALPDLSHVRIGHEKVFVKSKPH
jgi:LPS export ABC transporter protein LptC